MRHPKYCIELPQNENASFMHQSLKNIYSEIQKNPKLKEKFVLSDSGYAIGEKNWSFIQDEYPRLEEMRRHYSLEKHILFLSTPTDAPHSHLRAWPSSLCFPITGTNPDTWTYWLNPLEDITEKNNFFKHEEQKEKDLSDKATYKNLEQLPKWGQSVDSSYPYAVYRGRYEVLKKHCILEHPVIFDGNQWHYVISELKNFDRHSRLCVNWAAELNWDEFADLFFKGSI